ncbi:MAG: sulfatase-like hydrolase/transferase, partial [Candidatus Latescibacteria bacterium]|nr:sulfatase-like hydrolase/transferase [Candidatus Latescibacterota bacterium]
MVQENRPNVLFISFDDLNHYVGFLDRAPNAITPHFNRLAERCTVFERAYCQAPICNPSRASLMSGLRPSTTGVYNNRQPLRFSETGKNCVTLPQYFRQNGYLTTGSGKVY